MLAIFLQFNFSLQWFLLDVHTFREFEYIFFIHIFCAHHCRIDLSIIFTLLETREHCTDNTLRRNRTMKKLTGSSLMFFGVTLDQYTLIIKVFLLDAIFFEWIIVELTRFLDNLRQGKGGFIKVLAIYTLFDWFSLNFVCGGLKGWGTPVTEKLENKSPENVVSSEGTWTEFLHTRRKSFREISTSFQLLFCCSTVLLLLNSY